MIPKFAFTLIFLCLATIQLKAQQQTEQVESMLDEAAQLMDEHDDNGALQIYLNIIEISPDNYNALWNASLLYSAIGFRFDDEERQKEYFKKAQELAETSIDLYPDRGHPYYVMAVAKGRMADHVGVNRRIELGHIIEEYVKKAVDIMPEHAPSWHLYGVWQSEVANVSRAERIAARFISGGLPDGSNELAEEYLRKAIQFDPGSILIRFDLSLHFLRSGQDELAIPILEDLVEMEPKLKDDPEHIKAAKEHLRELRG